jgi:signal transduction histidine kinase
VAADAPGRPAARLQPTPPGAAPQTGGDDASLLRRTRLRLLGWSAGLTFLILVLLGALVFGAVSRELERRGTAILEQRVEEAAQAVRMPGPLGGRLQFGLLFGGEGAGMIAMAIQPDGTALGRLAGVEGLPVEESVAAAREGGRDVREATVEGTPIRVYSQAVERRDGQWVVQVIGERASELRLLAVLFGGLVVGGLAALLLALAAGWFYAGRALVPIRAAMERRNSALRRQREFAANASHELRAPLTVIRTSVTDLRRNADQPVARMGTALDDIDAEAAHLAMLVDDLLLLARTDSGMLEIERARLDLADVAAEAAGPLTAVAAASSVSLVVDPLPAAVDGDPLRLRQLVTILIQNALAHTPRDGAITVRVRVSDGAAVLTVDDDGPGVREEDRERVFERFWRADDAPAGGTGLGLAIARWIVERHGGRITAGNRPEGGARLEARLPLARV